MRINSTKYLLPAILLPIVSVQKKVLAPIFVDTIEYLSNSSNIAGVEYNALKTAMREPNITREVWVDSGYDWTKPFSQAVKVSGQTARLRIAYDVPIPEKIVENSTTAVASLSFSVPKSMLGQNGLPKPMDPSWALCRHIYVSTQIDSSKATSDSSCSFLPSQCASDVKDSLTKNWWKANPKWPCSESSFYAIAGSCQDSFGLARADVISYDSISTAHKLEMEAMAGDDESEVNWRIGTGYHDKGSKIAYGKASNRTFLIVDVWGHSKKVGAGERRNADATLTCLSAKFNTAPLDKSTTGGSNPSQTLIVNSSHQSSSANRIRSPPLINIVGRILSMGARLRSGPYHSS